MQIMKASHVHFLVATLENIILTYNQRTNGGLFISCTLGIDSDIQNAFYNTLQFGLAAIQVVKGDM